MHLRVEALCKLGMRRSESVGTEGEVLQGTEAGVREVWLGWGRSCWAVKDSTGDFERGRKGCRPAAFWQLADIMAFGGRISDIPGIVKKDR